MDVKTFAELGETPTLDQINLVLLIDYYETYLEPFVYSIKLKDKPVFELKCNRDNFPHLIGLHKPAEKKFGKESPIVKTYKGNSGYIRIRNGEITKQTLKDLNKTAYKDMKKSMVNFFRLHKLFENASAVYYDDQINNISQVDIMFYEATQKSYIHLGIIKHANQNYYVPTTFLIEPITEPTYGTKFIKDQTPAIIEKIEKKPRTN